MLRTPLGWFAIAWIFCTLPLRAHAQEAPPASGQNSASSGIFKQDTLTGDWFGYGKQLESVGFVLGADEVFDVLGNPAGGDRQGAIAEGRFEVFANLDLARTLGWSDATFHANAYEIHGRGFLPATSAIS